MNGKTIKSVRMRKLRNVLALTLAFGILAAILGVVSSRPAGAQPSATNFTDERPDSKPVLVVSDTSSPARTPLQTGITRTTSGFTSFDVPSDKRFVVEFVSGRCNSPQALTVVEVDVFTQVGSSGSVPHAFVPQLVFAGLSNAYTFSQQTRIYADGGTSVNLTIDSAGVGVAECSATLSGYLENP